MREKPSMMLVGGAWERYFGSILYIHRPPGANLEAENELLSIFNSVKEGDPFVAESELAVDLDWLVMNVGRLDSDVATYIKALSNDSGFLRRERGHDESVFRGRLRNLRTLYEGMRQEDVALTKFTRRNSEQIDARESKINQNKQTQTDNARWQGDWTHSSVEGNSWNVSDLLDFTALVVAVLVAAGLFWLFGHPTRGDWEPLAVFFLFVTSWQLLKMGFRDVETRLKRLEHRLIVIREELGNLDRS